MSYRDVSSVTASDTAVCLHSCCFFIRWQQHAGEDRDNCYYNEEFDEGEIYLRKLFVYFTHNTIPLFLG